MSNLFSRWSRIGAAAVQQQCENSIGLLSGVIIVTCDQKTPSAKYVELTYSPSDHKTALFIYKSKDKKRPEAAIDLSQASVFVHYENEHELGIIQRENHIYSLGLEQDRDDLSRIAARWRAALVVVKNPANCFTVMTVSGQDRHCVILVSFTTQSITFKYMSGCQKDTEINLTEINAVQRFGAGHEIFLETQKGDTFHFISKRPVALFERLQDKVCKAPSRVESLSTKSTDNDASQYASRTGYTPVQNAARATVPHVPDDYLTMDQVQTINRGPQIDQLTEGSRQPPLPPRITDPQDDYLPMSYQDPLISDYLTMESSVGLSAQNLDDIYLSSDQTNGTNEDDENVYFDPELMPPFVRPEIPVPPSRDVSAKLQSGDIETAVAQRQMTAKLKAAFSARPSFTPPAPDPFHGGSRHQEPELTKPALPERGEADRLRPSAPVRPGTRGKKKRRPKSTLENESFLPAASTPSALTLPARPVPNPGIKSPNLPPRGPRSS